ncbi:phage tail protein [Edwardsiella ictaluri]|uniref:phage tail-collar fiber domain-containing protein n=1 Tax=Edwardsiella ictaluri TaxID=67780 RepID=UPI0002E77EC6|nr:phage tail protein [Edwardsiella ictaluri]
MSATYFTLLTTVGETALASATTQDSPLRLTQMAVGDGNGNLPMPDSNQTQLVNERRRAPLNTLSIDPNNPNQIIAEQVLPEDVGGWWIREIGLYDEHDRLIAIGNCPPTYKPQLTEGSGRTQIIRMVLIISHTENVELKIDPAIVLATRQYVDESLAHHAQSRNHPDATLTTSGIVQLNDSISSTSTTQAATANAVKQAYDTGAQAKIRADSAYTLANDKWMAVNASTTRAGIVQLNDSINSTSTTQAATANAVKQAYDTGAQAKNRADSAYTLANDKWMAVNASTTRAGIVQLNDNINSTSTTQAATANAVKQAYDRAVRASQMTRTQLFSGDVGSGYIPLAQNPSNFHELIVIGCADNYWRGIIQVIPVWAARIITETGIAKDIGILYGDEAFWVIRPESFLTTRWEIERENCRIRQVWGVNYG